MSDMRRPPRFWFGAAASLGVLVAGACGRAPLSTDAGGGAGTTGAADGGTDLGAASCAGAGAAGTGGPTPVGDTTANPRFVFVSSVAYMAGELGGVDGADAKCQALASNAGLPGTYRAWLSGQAGSPSTRFRRDGGPFRLVDGSLVAESWGALTGSALRHAIDRTETGGPPPPVTAYHSIAGPVAWTSTVERGYSAPAGTCGDWSDPASTGPAPVCGHVISQEQWSASSSCGGCNATAPIYCFEQDGPDLASADAGAPVAGTSCVDAGPTFGPKAVFVTSQTFTADLGGLAGADAKCQALATAAGLTGTFRAWLSDGDGSPSTRFSRTGQPYRLVDGSVVADDWTALTSGVLRHAIDRTETGGPPPDSTGFCGSEPNLVWTDTNADGTLGSVAASCGGWTDVLSASVAAGSANKQDLAWTGHCFGPGCGGRAALYCFEQ